jgi:hypothetical protein
MASVAGNQNLYLRYMTSKGSRPFDMVGLPLSDLMELDRYLINGIHLRLVLHRNTSDFCLISGEDGDQGGYQVRIEDAYLRLWKAKVNPAILLAHSKLLKSVTAKYPYIRSETKCANIASGQSVFSWDHINSAYLPKLVIVSFVDSYAVLGSLKKNPFNMEHFDLRQISLLVNGIPCPGNPVSVNFNDGLVMEVLDRIYGSKGVMSGDSMGGISGKSRENVGISRKDLQKGHAIYVFDLAPVIDEGFHFELLNTGTLSLNVKFGSSLAQNVACIFYAEYDAMMEIDESRVVKLV